LALSSQQISVISVAVLSDRRDKRRTVSWWHLQNRVVIVARWVVTDRSSEALAGALKKLSDNC